MKSIRTPTILARVRSTWGVFALLGFAVAVIYGQAIAHEFVDFDDFIYVRDHPWLREPFDVAWLLRAFREPYAAYWIPLTWLSFRLDFAFYGDQPGGYVMTNLLLHTLNSGLLFVVFRRMTGAYWRSAFVAVAFAVHPQHVESVAWITERKDVLAAFFWIAGMGVYATPRRDSTAKSRIGSGARLLGVATCMVLGLCAKPMLVTFPLSLLLFDFWPLRRFQVETAEGLRLDRERLRAAVLEKIPLFAIAAGAALIVLQTQAEMGGRTFSQAVDSPLRLVNGIESIGAYLRDAVWPSGLAVFYPLDPDRPLGLLWLPIGAASILLTVLAIRERATRPWLLAGWLWFLVNLLPVLGFVGVGMQARADRWMYIPSIGLTWIIAWAAAEVAAPSVLATEVRGHSSRRSRREIVVAASLAVLLMAWSIRAHRQVATWRDTRTLFEHALAVTENNWLAHHRLGVWYRQHGELDAAFEHLVASLVALPRQARTQGELGDVALGLGRDDLADRLYRNVEATGWRDAHAAERLGRIWLEEGMIEPAIALFARVGRHEEARNRLLEMASRLDVEDPALATRLRHSAHRVEEALAKD